MMTVETMVRKSPVHGLGLFLVDPVKANGVLYRFNPDMDRKIPLAESDDCAKHYGYVCPRTPAWLSICGDIARYWNFPNPGTEANAIEGEIEASGEAVIRAATDIAGGSELLICITSDLDGSRKLQYTPWQHSDRE